MNVVFFVTSLDSGGLENYLLRFLKYKASGFQKVYVFCKSGKIGQLEQEFVAIPNVMIIAKKLNYFNLIDYVFLYKWLKKNEIDAVGDFTGNFAGLVLFIANLLRIKKRISLYRGSTHHFKRTLFRLIYDNFVKKLTLKFSTNILSNSKSAFDYFYPKIWEKDKRFEIIYNGIDIQSFIDEKENLREKLGIPENAFVVGHTGRYDEAKNHDMVLNVAFELCEKYPDIYFLLCGNGVKDNLYEKVKSQGREHKIFLFNNRSDIPRVLNTMDCYFFPSITEGQPNALIEAMLMKLPIVVSNIAPIKETIPEILYGQMIAPNDIKSAVEKIIEIKQNKYSFQDFNIQQWAIEKYNPNVWFDKFYNVIIK